MEKENLELIESNSSWKRIIGILEETNNKHDFTANVYKDDGGSIIIDFCLSEDCFEAPKIKSMWKKQ